MSFAPFERKMKAEGLDESCIRAFENSYNMLVSGESGMIPEARETTSRPRKPTMDERARGIVAFAHAYPWPTGVVAM